MKIPIFELSHYEFLRVCGDDAIAFLQGQLSCNMDLLTADQSLPGAICNLKGRVIADFRVVLHGEDCLLQTQAGMAEVIRTTLAKYAVFSKVKLSILDASELQVVGLIAKDAASLLTEKFTRCPAEDNQVTQTSTVSLINVSAASGRFELWFHQDQAKQEFVQNTELDLHQGLDLWEREELLAGVLHVTAPLSEKYTPQLLNYDISGLIDFKKGCYTGQEVVARMFYRGEAKKRLFLASSSHPVTELSTLSQVASAPGEANEITATQGEILRFSNGERISESNVDGEADKANLILAILNTDAAARTLEGTVQLTLSEQTESRLTIRNLPYQE